MTDSVLSFDELEQLSEDFFDTRDYHPNSELELDKDGLPLVEDSDDGNSFVELDDFRER